MRILQLGYYPIQPAVTGGQRRVAKLGSLLTSLDAEVLTAAIAPHRPDVSPADIVLSKSLNDWVFRVPYDFEMRVRHAVESDEFLSRQVKTMLRRFRPDLVWLEHPFLWPLIKRLKGHPNVAYSAHNIEWAMKRDYLKQQKICDPYCVNQIKLVEDDLASRAAFIVCCSEGDRANLKHLNPNILVVPNGADRPQVADPAKARGALAQYSKRLFEVPTFTYVSAAHAPNWFGLLDLVIEPLRNNPPRRDFVILLVGGICSIYREWEATNGPVKDLEIVAVPEATEDEKNLALLECHAVLLPITTGGGTNIKTAEALLSGKRIIGTAAAFRGFEAFMALPRVSLAGTGPEFSQQMIRVAAPAAGGNPCAAGSGAGDVAELSWDAILRSAREPVAALLSDLGRK